MTCWKESDLPRDNKLQATKKVVQTANKGNKVLPLEKTSMGNRIPDALVFKDEDLTVNLLSPSQLDESGHTIKIENGKMFVFDSDSHLVMEDRKENGLYMFDIDQKNIEKELCLLADSHPSLSKEQKLRLAHYRLGHRNLIAILRYIKNNLIDYDDFPLSIKQLEIQALPLCDACLRPKFTKLRRKGERIKVPFRTGSKIVTDMKGPVRITGLKGERYYQGFQCACSKYLVGNCFEKKSRAPANLKLAMGEQLFRDNFRNLPLRRGSGTLIKGNCSISNRERSKDDILTVVQKH